MAESKEDLDYINSFIGKHHVLSLATQDELEFSVCSMFYLYDAKNLFFIVASHSSTAHIRHIENNSNIAGNIFLETVDVSKIQGVQFSGKMFEVSDGKFKEKYIAKFPYTKNLSPKFFKIEVDLFKMTDNSFGFSKKTIYPSA